jgi:hypothetical protein
MSGQSGSDATFPARDPIGATELADQRLDVMLAFLTEIGILWREGEVSTKAFLPGVEVVAGELVIKRGQLQYPGDVLHEAGHIALLPPEQRGVFSGNVTDVSPEYEGYEMAVILWTYAACLHLALPVEYVVHDTGYQGQAGWLREEFAQGRFIGLPVLKWLRLADDPQVAGRAGFPEMLRWIR